MVIQCIFVILGSISFSVRSLWIGLISAWLGLYGIDIIMLCYQVHVL